MMYNTLPWPLWRADLSPDYTLFMPVNTLSRGVYQGTVPQRPGEPAPTPTPEAPNSDNANNVEMRTMGANTGAGATNTESSGVSGFASMFRWVSRQHNYESIQDNGPNNSSNDSGGNSDTVRNVMHHEG